MDTKRFNDYIQKIPTDRKALIPIYDEYYNRIVVHISYKFNKQIAEDVAQEFFTELMQIKANHKFIHYPTSWIYKCCDYIALKHFRCESGYVVNHAMYAGHCRGGFDCQRILYRIKRIYREYGADSYHICGDIF